jgi:uncharacterized membrane protein YgcG
MSKIARKVASSVAPTGLAGVTLLGFAFAFAASMVVVNCSEKTDDDPRALCIKVCDKTRACFGTAVVATDCITACNAQVPANGQMVCANAADLIAKAKECTGVGCGEIVPCAAKVPACVLADGGAGGAGGSGTGGESSAGGTGGSDETGGSAGSGTGGTTADAAVSDECADCVKADTCLGRLSDAGANNHLTMSCELSAGSDTQLTVITMCKQLLTSVLCK